MDQCASLHWGGPTLRRDWKTLMPAPAEDGTAQKRTPESDEASVWLRLDLGESLERRDITRQISSHSLEASLLAMAAERGLKHEDRLAMGITCIHLKWPTHMQEMPKLGRSA